LKYYCIAGEPSADSHTAQLVHKIKIYDSKAIFRGFGGEKMNNEGVKIDRSLSYLSFMGFTQVLRNIFTIFFNFKLAKKNIKKFHPDVVLLVDYPGFNLRMAKWCKKNGYKVFYYIPPQIWAWKYNRIYTLKKYVDMVFCILPFEKEIYQKENIHAHYVSHPLLNTIRLNTSHPKKDYLALFPGSRQQEIQKHLPILLDLARKLPMQEFILAGVKDFDYKALPVNVLLIIDKPLEVLQHAKAAIVASGTATLEAAMLNIPTVVIYKTNSLNYRIAKRLITVKWISLANIIAQRTLFPECVQEDCNSDTIIKKLQILESNTYDYKKIILEKLFSIPTDDAAKIIYECVAKYCKATR
jgi:lipid-A-disaccharide synthase